MLETNLLSLLNNKLKTSLTVLTKNIIFFRTWSWGIFPTIWKTRNILFTSVQMLLNPEKTLLISWINISNHLLGCFLLSQFHQPKNKISSILDIFELATPCPIEPGNKNRTWCSLLIINYAVNIWPWVINLLHYLLCWLSIKHGQHII